MPTFRRALNLLRNRTVILALGIALGLLGGPRLAWTAQLTLPALAIVMTAAASQVPSSAVSQPRLLLRSTALAVAASYVVSAAITLALARWLAPETDLWTGFVLVAASPPGVAVLPFSVSLGGDSGLALGGTAGAYLAALAIAPLLAGVLVGSSLIQPARLLVILGELVVGPLVLSRLLRRGRLAERIAPWRGTVVNWGLFVVVLAAVALNRDLFLREPLVLLRTGAVCLAATFGVGLLGEGLLRRAGVAQSERVSLQLFATVKNSGFATATGLALAGERASVPGAVMSAVIVLWLIWLEVRRPPMVPL